MGLWPLTVVFETVSLHLRLKRTKSDLAPIVQDPALPAADLNSVDLQRPNSEKFKRQHSKFNVRRFHS